MGVLTDLPIRQVFKHARRMRPEDKTPSRSNLCEARQRLAVEPVRRVFDLVVKPLATPQTLGGFYHDLRLMGIDGTVLDVPDTPANDAHFGRSSGGRGNSAFPQVRKVSLVELGTHVEVGRRCINEICKKGILYVGASRKVRAHGWSTMVASPRRSRTRERTATWPDSLWVDRKYVRRSFQSSQARPRRRCRGIVVV